MRPYIPNLRAIEARYYGPTDTRGSRVRLRDLRGILPTRWIDFDQAYSSAADTARAFLESEGWTLAHGAETPDAFLWLSPDFRRDSWTAPEPQEAAQPETEPQRTGLDSGVLAQVLEKIHRLASRTAHGQDPEGLRGWEPVAVHRLEKIVAITRPTLRAHLGRGAAR